MTARAPLVITASVLVTGGVFWYSPPEAELAEPQAAVSIKSSAAWVKGPKVQTDYGPVQVRIVVDESTGSVAAATAVVFPVDLPKSQQINSAAIPQLEAQAVGATSIDAIATVSGATYTSAGFRKSLGKALLKARNRPAPPTGTGDIAAAGRLT